MLGFIWNCRILYNNVNRTCMLDSKHWIALDKQILRLTLDYIACIRSYDDRRRIYACVYHTMHTAVADTSDICECVLIFTISMWPQHIAIMKLNKPEVNTTVYVAGMAGLYVFIATFYINRPVDKIQQYTLMSIYLTARGGSKLCVPFFSHLFQGSACFTTCSSFALQTCKLCNQGAKRMSGKMSALLHA